MSAVPARPDVAAAGRDARTLDLLHGDLDAPDLLARAIGDLFRGRIALVSSFGTESAVLLHLAASIDRHLPVIFLDTGKLFEETHAYRQTLIARLGLTDVRVIRPDPARLGVADPDGRLWRHDPDRCCSIRKVSPLAAALAPFAAWITGRKRFQGGARAALPAFEAEASGRIKVNPLAGWNFERIEAYFDAHDLPRHPLEADGFLSVGCLTCTAPVDAGGDRRSGRWAGHGKTECGIHLPALGVEQE